MKVSTDTSSGGGGMFLLFLLFLGLKLGGAIDWSWWWVTAPLWAAFALVFGVLAIMLVFALVVASVATLIEGRRRW